MRTLSRTAISLFVGLVWIVLAIQSGAAAQGNPPGGGRRGGSGGGRPPVTVPDSAQTVKMVDSLASQLSLSDDQKEDVLELHLVHFKKVVDLMKQNSGDRKGHRDQMEALQDEFLEDMKELLSDDQFERYEEHIKKRGPRSGPPKRRGN